MARVDVPMPDHGESAAKNDKVKRLRSQVAPKPSNSSARRARQEALVTGETASNMDYSARMASTTPRRSSRSSSRWASCCCCLRSVHRSWAASVMLLNLLSVGAAYGILVAVFQHTWAEQLLSTSSPPAASSTGSRCSCS